MTTDNGADAARRYYRVDRFVVPEAAREEFFGRVRATHELLRRQAGFIQDLVLEEPAGAEGFRVVTMVEWTGVEVLEPVRAAVTALHQRLGFSPQEVFARLGIRAELGNYRQAGV